MWQSPAQKIALLELLVHRALKRRASQAEAYDTLADLPWTRATGRRNQIALVETHRSELVALLGHVWPDWESVLAQLIAAGIPPTPDGWVRLEDIHRARRLPTLPVRLNRRTAAALTAPHSKAYLTLHRQTALAGTQTTRDGVLRLRPPRGLMARTTQNVLDLWELAQSLGEAPIPERAFLDGLRLEGSLRAVLLVENAGAWRDLPALDGWLVAHVPGWDSSTVEHLLNQLKPDVPVVHFGDLDPNGVRIFHRLRHRYPTMAWFVPEFWLDCVQPTRLKRPWPSKMDLSTAPPLVKYLASKQLWLEQESLVLDPRLHLALETCATGS